MLIPNIEEHLHTTVAEKQKVGHFTYASRPGIYYLPGYLTVDECNYVVYQCEQHIDQAHHTAELSVDSPSFQCYTWRISFYPDEILKNICSRLASLVNLPLELAEYLEVRRFDNMGFYNKMCDHIEDSDILAQTGGTWEFPTAAWEVLEPGHKQMSPRGSVIAAVNVTMFENDSVRFKYKNLSLPPLVPEQGMAIVNAVQTDNIQWDVTTNLSDIPFWMMKLKFREIGRTVETGAT